MELLFLVIYIFSICVCLLYIMGILFALILIFCVATVTISFIKRIKEARDGKAKKKETTKNGESRQEN